MIVEYWGFEMKLHLHFSICGKEWLGIDLPCWLIEYRRSKTDVGVQALWMESGVNDRRGQIIAVHLCVWFFGGLLREWRDMSVAFGAEVKRLDVNEVFEASTSI